MNTLVVENEELKKEVRKIRWAPPPAFNEMISAEPGVMFVLTAAPENATDFDVAFDDIDEGFVEVEHEEELLPLPKPKLPLEDQYDEEEDEVELDKVRPISTVQGDTSGRAVGSYSSGHQPWELPKSKSTQPRFATRCVTL